MDKRGTVMKYITTFISIFLLITGCAYESEGIHEKPTTLVINEVSSNNCTGLIDAYGKSSNWIELYNSSSEPLNLSNYFLTDSREKLTKWNLGERIIPSGGYEVVHASGRNYRDTTSAPSRTEVKIFYAYGWSDGELDGGKSWVKPFAFEKIQGENSDGNVAVSASMYFGDCIETLGWDGDAHVDVTLKVAPFNADNFLSLDKYNQIELQGYFEKGKKYKISYLLDNLGDPENEGIPYFSGLENSLIGTGIENDIYRIQINRSENDNLVDFKNLSGIRIRNKEFTDTLDFTLNNVYFSSTVGNFHTSFKISSEGDELYLSNEKGEVVDSVFIPALRPDHSYGRNSNHILSYFSTPTPGIKNGESVIEAVATGAMHTTPGGFYDKAVTVSLAKESGCEIYYTLDGSVPTKESRHYKEPFILHQTSVLRTATFKDGALAGAITSETYFINEESSMPIVSLIVDPEEMFDSISGIYMPGPNASETFPHFGGNFWDKDLMIDAHMEFYENKKVKGFERPLGLKIHGGWSRGAGKKSLALMFKEQYGSYLEYPLFPEYPNARKFKSLILRMGGDHCTDVMIYDVFNSYLMKGRGIDYQKARSAKLFINGNYWGLYNIREKLNEHYFTTNYGLEGDEINLVKDGGQVQQGSVTDYVKMINFLRNNDLDDSLSYEYLKTCMDVHNYIDYMATQIFIVNNDWPANNIKWWKSTHPGGKWRWVIYDTDGAGLDDENYVETNMMEYATNEDKSIDFPNGADFTYLFRKLLESDEFKQDFINRTMTLLNTNFHPESYKAKLDHLLSFIGDEYKRDFERWHLDITQWSAKVSNMRAFAERRPDVVRKNIQEFFSFSDPVSITLSTEKGQILINKLSAGSTLKGFYYPDITLKVSLTDTTGFSQWSDGNINHIRTVTPNDGLQLKAQFK